ncbi:hypothetical protein N7493_000251 [Penicillium malachiteum]|uniref:GPI anchored serine-rich protein n=1 Tax=Penicillium malachiteum TaxID=1324776 RepID=A0AAD6N0R1_9EURO|nr:hypothetical protein N7493_000251 [Penicillium malachiteum]
MRFTIAAVAFFAGLVAADTTIFETEQVTVTSCGPEVTNCPAASGVATSVPVVPTSVVVPNGVGAASSGAPSWTTAVPAAPATTGAAAPAGGNTAAQSYTVIAHTTCVPTVVYSTIPIAQTTSPVGSGSNPGSGASGAPHVPSSSKAAPSGASASSSPSATPVYSGAGAISGSMGFAGLFAAAAYILA